MVALNWDVISIICDNLDWHADLLHLALTCKTFLEPALDHLWRNIGTSEQLLCVLPETQEVDFAKMIFGPVAQTSWDRLLYYTRRVRHWDRCFVRRCSGVDIHPANYAVLSAPGPQCPLFPYVNSIKIGPRIAQSGLLRLFLSDTIQEVALSADLGSVHKSRVDFGPAVSLIAHYGSQLRTLTVTGPCAKLHLSLQKLERLHSLTLSVFDRDFMGSFLMNTISFLPELKTLVLSISSIPEDDWEMDNRTGVSWTNFQDIAVGFISLAYLDIRTTPPALLILLDAIPSNQLSGLVFTLENSTGENETSAETALQQVSVMFPKLAVKQPSIKSLSFTWSRGHFPVERENNDVHRWRSAFETLFSMSSLAKLTYHFPLLLDEQLVKEMAEAWSEMTDLRITSGDDSVYISTLSHFALNCPHLEVLDVPFIPFVLGDAPCDCSGLFAHPLKTLVAPYTDPENPEMTAKQLTRMFPYVGVIRREYTISPAWKEVQRILETDRVEKDTEPGV